MKKTFFNIEIMATIKIILQVKRIIPKKDYTIIKYYKIYFCIMWLHKLTTCDLTIDILLKTYVIQNNNK